MHAIEPFKALRYDDERVELAAVIHRAGEDSRHAGQLLEPRVEGEDPDFSRRAMRQALYLANWKRARVVERAVVLAEGDQLSVEDLPPRLQNPIDPSRIILQSDDLSIKKMQRFMEKTLIERALEKTEGNRTAASKLLEISHRALLYKIKDYGLK